MADRLSREQWRIRAERFLESDMSVREWCAANRVSTSAMFRHLGELADREPEVFGGSRNIVDRSQARWITKTRENMRASVALSAPAQAAPPGFVRVADIVPAEPEPGPIPGRRPAAAMTVAVNGAVVSVPPGFPQSDAIAVLKAVASL